MKEVKVSCIIPCYNSEHYIANTLDSVLSQDLQEIEIIIINDASEDNSLDIIKDYAKKDNRIIIINLKDNVGISCARNRGLEISKGEYIFFLDSDDILEKGTFIDLYQRAKKDNLDLLLFDYKKQVDDTKFRLITRKLDDKKVYMNNKDKKALLKEGGVPVWNKFYRKVFLQEKNVEFIPNILYEDIPYHFMVILKASRIGYLKKSCLYYIKREGSIMAQELNYYDIIKSVRVLRRIVQQKPYLDFQEDIDIKSLKTFTNFFSNIRQNQFESFSVFSQEMKNIDIKKYKNKIKFYRYLQFLLMRSKRYFLYRILFKWF